MTAPFLEYLTVFRARLGAVNIVLGLTSFAHLPEESLLRKTKKLLEKKVALNLADRENHFVFDYLKDKGFNQPSDRRRYNEFSLSKRDDDWYAKNKRDESCDQIEVFQTDLWMADPRIRSTIGVPTPDNVNEIVDLTLQIHLLSRGKLTWTSAGHLIQRLRSYALAEGAAKSENPFLIGFEAAALLRQVIEFDGYLMREVVRLLLANSAESGNDVVSRDDIAGRFDEVVSSATKALHGHFPATEIYKVARFKKQIEKTVERRVGQSRGPGVLEHRVSPRLEWLVDLGYLSKGGPLPKNGFVYRIEPAAKSLLIDLDNRIGDDHWAESVAISQWKTNPIWNGLRSKIHSKKQSQLGNRADTFVKAYQLLQRPIGPSPLNDVVFVAALFLPSANSYSEVEAEIIDFAQRTEGVSLSGGRTQRRPQNIYIPPKMLLSAGFER